MTIDVNTKDESKVNISQEMSDIHTCVSNETEKQRILCKWKTKINIWYLQFINIREVFQLLQYVCICNLLLLVCSLISIFISLCTLLKISWNSDSFGSEKTILSFLTILFQMQRKRKLVSWSLSSYYKRI